MLHVYHWKHGWIPLDHIAALSKSKGSELLARRYLADSHAAGVTHHSVVTGSFGGGTHVRGLHPVAREALHRHYKIHAAYNPETNAFHLLDTSGPHQAAAVPEHVADELNRGGYTIHAVKSRKLHVRKAGEEHVIHANGSDLHLIHTPDAWDAEHTQHSVAAQMTPRRQLMADYYAAREAHELARDAATKGYPTEVREWNALHPFSFRLWMKTYRRAA